MISCKKGNSSLFSVITHEHGNEERQDEDSAKQVEDDEEHRILPAIQVFGLTVYASDCHACEHDVCPAFLRYDLEEEEQGVAKVVKVEERITCSAWSQHIPVVWRTGILADTVLKVTSSEVSIVAGLELANEEIQTVYGKRNQQA